LDFDDQLGLIELSLQTVILALQLLDPSRFRLRLAPSFDLKTLVDLRPPFGEVGRVETFAPKESTQLARLLHLRCLLDHRSFIGGRKDPSSGLLGNLGV
jgi:hypothetical protein